MLPNRAKHFHVELFDPQGKIRATTFNFTVVFWLKIDTCSLGLIFLFFLSFLHYILYVIFVNSSLYIFMNTLDKIYSYECFGQKLRFS